MLDRLNPRQRKIALVVAAAAGLALIALMTRRAGGNTARQPATDPFAEGAVASSAAPWGSTFADNGEAAAGLSTSITEGLGTVGAGLDAVAVSNEALPAAVAAAVGDLLLPALEQREVAQPSPATSPAATPATGDQRLPKRTRAKVRGKTRPIREQKQGPRAGLAFVTVEGKKGRVRLYESEAGKGDFGQKRGSRVAAGPAKTKPRLPKPKPRQKAKAPARTPSKRPAGTTSPRPPSRRKKKRRP